MRFSIGDLVVEKKDLQAHTSYNVQKVVSFLGESLLTTHYGHAFDGEVDPDTFSDNKPGSRMWRTNIIRVEEKELCTPEEAIEEIRRLESLASKMSAEFELVRDQVKLNLNQAAALVNKAAELIKPGNKEFYDLPQECSELYLSLKNGGWSHSTMVCRYGR